MMDDNFDLHGTKAKVMVDWCGQCRGCICTNYDYRIFINVRVQNIGANSMGAIAPTAKKLWGPLYAPNSPPQELC